MTKRILDLVVATTATIVSAPMVLLLMGIVWLYDRHNPIYVPRRIGKDGRPFTVFKLRTMRIDADQMGVDTTIKGDSRLLPFAEPIRRLKLDELPQFWNVLLGNMSLVGPRPNVFREVEKYTQDERRLLTVTPGLTDIASIVFSDLSGLLAGATDANQAYERIVRPTKSKLGLFYVDHQSFRLDVLLILATAIAIADRESAVRIVCRELRRTAAGRELVPLLTATLTHSEMAS